MWEEGVESIRVVRRLVSELRQDSDEETGEEKVPLLPSTGEKSPSVAGQVVQPPSAGTPPRSPVLRGGARAEHRLTRPESLYMSDGPPPTKMVLSSWGQPFSDSTSEVSATQPCIYGMLSAERPHYHNQALGFADRFTKIARISQKTAPLRWDSPDFRVLYRFSTVSEYESMVRDFKEGKLKEINVKGEKLRGVQLEPVRVIDANLKCTLEMVFPASCNEEIKDSLKPLLDTVAISRKFIFIPSLSHFKQLEAIEEADAPKSYPSVFLSLITSQPHTSTARKVRAGSAPNWEKLVLDIPVDPNHPPPFQHDELYVHKKHSLILPVVSLTAGHAGAMMADGIRVTLLCGANYEAMAKFYGVLLGTEPAKTTNYVIFQLMENPTSLLELCLYTPPTSLAVGPLDLVTLHFFVHDMALLVARLIQQCGCDIGDLGKGVWHLKDPCGNRVTIHDKDMIAAAHWNCTWS